MKKNLFKLTWLFLAAMLTFTACNDDDPDPIDVEDGWYIKGAGTALTELDAKGLFKSTKNEVGQVERASLYEIYIAVEGGTEGFNIIKVEGGVEFVYGPGTDFALVATEALHVEEPKNGLWKGTFGEGTAAYVVPTDGLYHVVFDTEVNKVAIAKADWGVIGGATPGGWSQSTAMPATFNLEAMTFEVNPITLLQNEFKFRYSDGWKIFFEEGVLSVNTNFGGTLTALEPGGANLANAVYANYKVQLTWTLGANYGAAVTYVSDAEPLPEYPENLYMIGATIGGWDWTANGIKMHPVHSHPELFWAIVWCEAGVADAGIKFAPGMEWVGDFGVTGDATDGVWGKGSNNLPDVAASGYYTIVVDLENNTIERNSPKVYLIGDCVGSWDAGNVDAMFTPTATDLTLTKDLSAGNLRMYVGATTLACDWWQAEFNVFGTEIQYREIGGDQAAVALTAGNYTISLEFKTNTGSVTAN
jgi:hypothetical protein